MSDKKTDEIKGRAKEAAGALTDNDDLEREGERDQQAAEAKSKVDEAADKVKDGVDKIKSGLSGD